MHLSGGFRLSSQSHDTNLDAKNQIGGQRGQEGAGKAWKKGSHGPDAKYISGFWQAHDCCGAFAGLALQFDGAAGSLDHGLADGEAQAGAARGTRT
jgi:hypothetical protein